jgi:hypothetical protein
MAAGFIIQEIITPNMVSRSPLNYASEGQNYTTGGVTFSYPSGWFTLPPIVNVSILQNAPHSTNTTYVAELSANTATSTTVMVYQVSFGVVNEAPNNSVTVCLLAIEDPA